MTVSHPAPGTVVSVGNVTVRAWWMGHRAVSDEFGEELSPYRSRVVYAKMENLRWARKLEKACECQHGKI